MKSSKKPELLTLKKATVPKPQHEPIEEVSSSKPIADQQPSRDLKTIAEGYLQSYTPTQDYPVLPSAANSGWQASDIWRDLRVDSFYD